LPQTRIIESRVLDAQTRPVSAVADQREVRDVASVRVITDKSVRLELLFDPGYALDDRIVLEQFAS
jgi:NAD+ kinase